MIQQEQDMVMTSGFLLLSGCGCIGSLLFLVIHIVIIVWMYKDATSRKMEAPWIWLLAGFFVPVVGLIVYLLVRPPKP